MDWNELMKDADISLAAPGEYDMIVHSAEATTYGTGNQGIKAVFMFENGPHAGQKVFNNFVIVSGNNRALAMFFRNMKTLGLDADFFGKNPQLDEVAKALEGRRARVVLAHREWQGNMQYDVSGIKVPNGAANGGVTTKPSGPSVPSAMPSAPSVPSTPQVPTAPKVISSAPPVPPSI